MCLSLALMGLLMGSTLYEADIEDSITRDIYNYTESKLKWNESLFNVQTNFSNKSIEYISSSRIINIVYKVIDCVGYSFFEIEKWFIELGYTHPQYNYLLLIRLVIFCIILYLLIPFLIVCYIVYLLSSLIYNKFRKKK